MGSRIATSSVLGFTVALGVAAGIVGSTTHSQTQAWDDISDYDGTKCSAAQLYDATDGQCATDVVTNNPQESDDMSDFDGTICPSDQLYDASDTQCTPTVVTNDPQAPLQPNSVGISDPGKTCAETQDFVVPDQKCMPDVVTNDPQAVVPIEGENPTAYTPPRETRVQNCAGTSDPLGMCS